MNNFGDQPQSSNKKSSVHFFNDYDHTAYQAGNYYANQNYDNFQSDSPKQYLYSEHSNPACVSDLYGTARKNFIKKVYIILSAQLLFTVFMTSLSMMSQAFFTFQLEHIWLFYVALIIAVAIQIYIFCCSGGRTYPGNFITTALFTFCEGYMVSFISSITGKTSGNSIVFLAALMTLTITVACTLYAIFTDEDFTTCGALIAVVAGLMFILFIILLFTDSPFIHILYCALGVFMAGLYLIIDTQMIVGGRSVQLTVDEYYLGAMLLYIDIISLFLYLLDLLRQINGNQ